MIIVYLKNLRSNNENVRIPYFYFSIRSLSSDINKYLEFDISKVRRFHLIYFSIRIYIVLGGYFFVILCKKKHKFYLGSEG